MNVDVQTMDWGTLMQRRASQNSPTSVAGTYTSRRSADEQLRPGRPSPLRANGKQGWFGWPTTERSRRCGKRGSMRRTRPRARSSASKLQMQSGRTCRYPVGRLLNASGSVAAGAASRADAAVLPTAPHMSLAIDEHFHRFVQRVVRLTSVDATPSPPGLRARPGSAAGFSIECNHFAPPAGRSQFAACWRGCGGDDRAKPNARRARQMPGFVADMDAAGLGSRGRSTWRWPSRTARSKTRLRGTLHNLARRTARAAGHIDGVSA